MCHLSFFLPFLFIYFSFLSFFFFLLFLFFLLASSSYTFYFLLFRPFLLQWYSTKPWFRYVKYIIVCGASVTLSLKVRHCLIFSKRSSSMLWKSHIFCRNCRHKVFSYTFYSCFKSVGAWNGLTSYVWVLSCVECFAVLICTWLYSINKFHFYQYKKTIMLIFFFL